MKVFCCVCGKQCVSYNVPPDDECRTIAAGAKAGFKPSEVFCGYCAKELNDQGLFQDEAALADEETK